MATKKDIVRDLINARDYVWGHTEADEEPAAMWAVEIVAEFLKVELPPWIRPTARPFGADTRANAEVDAAISANVPPF